MQNVFYITKTSYFTNAGCLFFCANFHCLFQKIVFSQISSKVHLEHRVKRTLRSLRYLVISEFPIIPQEKNRLSFVHESSTNFTNIRIGESNQDISMLVSYSCNQFEVFDFFLLNVRIWKKMLPNQYRCGKMLHKNVYSSNLDMTHKFIAVSAVDVWWYYSFPA